MKLWKWIKDLWYLPESKFFELEEGKQYTDGEILNILSNETLRIGVGNCLVLVLLFNYKKRLEALEGKE